MVTAESQVQVQQLADDLLVRAGCNIARGATAADIVHATAELLGYYAEDNTGQYTPDDYQFVLATVHTLVNSPRRHGH